MGGRSQRSVAVANGLSSGTASEAAAPSLSQALETADYWTPSQLEPAGVCQPSLQSPSAARVQAPIFLDRLQNSTRAAGN